MHLKTLKITGWRNYTGENTIFSPGINLFLGYNGQGKTNLLEAIYFLSCGQSPRTAKIDELINWAGNYFYLKGEVNTDQANTFIEMGGARDGRRITKIDGIPVQRLAELSQVLTAVFFMPEDLYLVKGGPARRRRFLDMEIGQLNASYRHASLEYKKVLRERNALLKSKKQDKLVLEVLTKKLTELAGPIAKMRQDYLDKLSILARLKHRKLSDNRENLSLKYKWSIKPGSSTTEILEMFSQVSKLEQRYMSTMLGPHKDDFTFLVNGADLRTFGSQGQQRTAILSLKLAELDLFKSETGEYPVLLLDDVLSELDEIRKAKLFEYLSGRIQTFISSAEPLSSQTKFKAYRIEAGSISEGV